MDLLVRVLLFASFLISMGITDSESFDWNDRDASTSHFSSHGTATAATTLSGPSSPATMPPELDVSSFESAALLEKYATPATATKCGMECARQNTDCGLEVASKVSALAMAIFGTATFGVVGELVKLGKKLTWAVKCTNQLLLVMRGIIRYVRNVKTEDPQTSQEKLLLMLYQTNNVVTDLPMVIYACMGKDIPSKLRLSQIVLATSQWMLLQALTYDDNIISSWGRFRAFMKGANFTDAAEEITDGEIESLETAMKQNSSCGGDLKSLTDRVWMTVNEYREGNPAITDDELPLDF
ncbi:unnamed protein product [Phytophthora fragariaefolia]|uniref:Unnamed protein product n=1 Tax=Phytophthora fragariaefolia TaxID=1490495 RepID=A0A9W6UC15_9STRA|nr:unnamed protein product [Phytophthora fragariaefolia]